MDQMDEMHKVIGGLLQLAGVFCLVFAAHLAFGIGAGLAAAGVAMLVLGYLVFK